MNRHLYCHYEASSVAIEMRASGKQQEWNTSTAKCEGNEESGGGGDEMGGGLGAGWVGPDAWMPLAQGPCTRYSSSPTCAPRL